MSSKTNPGAFDCFAAAEPDEEMFILLGRDPWAGSFVRRWIDLRTLNGERADKLEEAKACADRLDAWAVKLGKTPRNIDELQAGTRLTLGIRDFLVVQTGGGHLGREQRTALQEAMAGIFHTLPERIVIVPPGFAFQVITKVE